MSKEKTLFFTAKRKRVLEDISQLWLQNARNHLKEASYIKYRNILYNHILPEIGYLKLSELTTERIGAFVEIKLSDGRRDKKGGLKEKSTKDILTVLKQICVYAAQTGYEVPCRFEQIKVRQNAREVRILSRNEQELLGKYLFEDERLTKTGVLLSLYMGLRLGEVCALRREHIIYGERVLRVRLTMQRIQDPKLDGGRRTKIIVTEPKSQKSVRDIPIPPILLERLLALQRLPDDAYLLTGSAEKFIEPRTMENIFKRYLQECRMDAVNYHALRHTFATRCIERGFDVKTLSEILGHANVNITLNRYVHSSIERKRENMQKLRVLC